jgi:hypothetical protein
MGEPRACARGLGAAGRPVIPWGWALVTLFAGIVIGSVSVGLSLARVSRADHER